MCCVGFISDVMVMLVIFLFEGGVFFFLLFGLSGMVNIFRCVVMLSIIR